MTERRTGSYWPDGEQALILRGALGGAGEARSAWGAIGPRLDAHLADRASSQLLPLLGARLAELGVDDPRVERLRALHARTSAENGALFAGGRTLLLALDGAGIETLMLKGGALAVAVYRDPGLRPMRDLDVLVPLHRVAAASDAWQAAGWTPRAPLTPARIRTLHATEGLVGVGAARCDLHWHVYWECCQPDADDDLWSASVPLRFAGVATRMLGPADHLLHVLVHGSRRARRPRVIWVADAILLMRAGGIDWARLVAQAGRRRVSLRAAAMLAYLSRTFKAPVPDEALRELWALPVSRLERFEHRVGQAPPGLLGELPSYWCAYRRLEGDRPIPSPLGFARYLQQTWRAPSLRDMARGAVRRARDRARAAIRAL